MRGAKQLRASLKRTGKPFVLHINQRAKTGGLNAQVLNWMIESQASDKGLKGMMRTASGVQFAKATLLARLIERINQLQRPS